MAPENPDLKSETWATNLIHGGGQIKTRALFFRAIFKALLVAVQEGGVLRVDDAQISGQA